MKRTGHRARETDITSSWPITVGDITYKTRAYLTCSRYVGWEQEGQGKSTFKTT